MGDDNNGECVAHGKNQAFVGRNLQGILGLVDNPLHNGAELHEAFSAAANAGAAEMLARVGMTPEHIAELVRKALAWALPNMVLGSMIIVPLWAIAYMLRPPRG